MLKSFSKLAVVMTVLVAAVFSSAETKVAVMDYQAVLFNSIAAEDASVVLRENLAQVQARLQEIEQGIESRQGRLETDKDILTEDELQQYNQELQTLAMEQQQLAGVIQQTQQQSRIQFNEQFKPLIRELVVGYVADTNYNLIVEAQAVLWNVDTPDITEDILALFNAEYAKLKEANAQ